MNKAEFIKAIADKAELKVKDVEAAYAATLEVLEAALKAGEKVVLVGVGTAELKHVDAKKGINPKTKAEVKIPACNKPAFKFGNAYKARFN